VKEDQASCFSEATYRRSWTECANSHQVLNLISGAGKLRPLTGEERLCFSSMHRRWNTVNPVQSTASGRLLLCLNVGGPPENDQTPACKQ
jgi:hypothetical protein